MSSIVVKRKGRGTADLIEREGNRRRQDQCEARNRVGPGLETCKVRRFRREIPRGRRGIKTKKRRSKQIGEKPGSERKDNRSQFDY